MLNEKSKIIEGVRMRILDIVGVILDNRFWSRYPVNHELSNLLEKLMDQGVKVVAVDKYTTTLGHLEIWLGTETSFFSFGGLYPREGNRTVPRRRTALRLKKYILQS